jgi:hypothetical protein
MIAILKLEKAVTCVESCYSLAVARSKSVVAKVLGRAAGRSDAGNSGGYMVAILITCRGPTGAKTEVWYVDSRCGFVPRWRLKPMRIGDAPRSDMR